MKTKNLNITVSSTLMVLLMGLSLAVFGQTRTNYSRGGNASSGTRTVTATRSSNERTVVTQRETGNNARTSFRNTESRPAVSGNNSHAGNKSWDNNSGSNKNNSNNWNSNNYNKNGHNDHGNYSNNHDDHWTNGYGHNDHYYYGNHHHPKTYNAWNFPAPWQYSSHAVVFRHGHDDFFFYNNAFYRYSAFRGYYAVGCPEGIIFTYLPVGYNEVMINGRIYYRYGNVFFEPVYEGYRIITPPSGIYVTFNF